MKSKFLLLMLFSSIIGSTECGSLQINVPNEWVFTVLENETKPLEITCTGDKQLMWNTMMDKTFVNYKNGFNGKEFYSTLLINEPIKEDTGYFNCSYVGEEEETTISTYVYVDDGTSGFVIDKDSLTETVRVEIGEPILLDCRTTRPDIKVTLFKNEKDVTNEFSLDYNRWFRKPEVSHQDSSIYGCKENKFGSLKTFLVTVQLENKLPQPWIENRNSDYVVGKDFAFNCTIPVDRNLTFKWILPNKNADKHITLSKNKFYKTSTLKIKDPTLSDSGNYTCIVERGNSSSSDTKNIIVSIAPFVHFHGKNNAKPLVLFIKEGENFQWVMHFEGYPRYLTYTFYKPDKSVLQGDNRVSTIYDYEDGKLTLKINNISAEDFGNYSVRMETPNGSYDETYAILIVNATPKIEFNEIPSLLTATENISITANILAYSINQAQPNVNWYFFSNCSRGIGSCDKNIGMMLPHKLEKDSGFSNRYKSIIIISPSTSGKLVCQVWNDVGSNFTETYLNVSDKMAPFLVTVQTSDEIVNVTNLETNKTINVIEGDNITAECSALHFLFDNVSFNYAEGTSQCDSELSLGKCINILNVSSRDDQVYECVAKYRVTNKVEMISFGINVLEMMAPRVLSNSSVSIEGKTLLVKSPYPDPFPVYFYCYVEGNPQPKIKWLKDGKYINDIKNQVLLRNKNQTLEIKFSTKEDEGKYECDVENRAGRIQPFTNVKIEGQNLRSVNLSIISTIVGIFFVICSVLGLLYVRLRKKINVRNDLQTAKLCLFQSRNAGYLNKECPIGDQIEMLPYDNIYEVDRENIRLGKQLGAGAFGRVLLSEVKGLKEMPSPTRVAVKMCKYEGDVTHLRSLILELKIMIHLGKHLNIVNLIGAHTSNLVKGELWILLEYCKYGNLLKFIQRSKVNFINQIDPTTGDINVHKASLLLSKSSSSTSLGSRVRFWRESTLNSDESLEAHHGRLMNSFQSKGQHPSTTPKGVSNLNSDEYSEMNFEGSMKKNQSIGRQSLTSSKTRSKEQTLPSNSPTLVCEGEQHEMAAKQPMANFKSEEESSIFNSISESDYSAMLNTDETIGYSPPPFPATLGSVPGVSSPFTTVDIICWAWQIAKGMEFLTRRNVLHGDLAARNLLLADNNVVKICDFGLSREMYQNDEYLKKSNNIMPIKWMSPEAIRQKIFSIQSDVWAYGVTLWELFTLGDTPYAGLPIKREFAIALEKGMRLEKPLYCNDEIYSLLLDCWQLNPVERPSFSRISDFLSDMLSQDRKQHYVNMNSVYKQKNEEWLSQNEDYLTMVICPDFKNLISPLREERKIPEPFEGKCKFDGDYLEGEQCGAAGGYLDVLKPKPDHLLRPHSQRDQGGNKKGFC